MHAAEHAEGVGAGMGGTGRWEAAVVVTCLWDARVLGAERGEEQMLTFCHRSWVPKCLWKDLAASQGAMALQGGITGLNQLFINRQDNRHYNWL